MFELGASCKKARESQNLSIDRIAAETRISGRFLLAIESEQFEVLPGGVFNRGFIRTYAERLGMDPDEAIRAYESSTRVVDPETPRQESHRFHEKSAKIPIYYAAGIVFLLLVVCFYVWMRPGAPSQAPAVTANTPAPEAAVPALVKEDTVRKPDEPASLVASAPETTPVVKAVEPASAPVVIELEVLENSWFQLSSDGAAVVVSEMLTPGTTRRYLANNSMDVSIGNAAGIHMRVNGQPVSSLGKSGQVRRLSITPTTSAASLVVKAAE